MDWPELSGHLKLPTIEDTAACLLASPVQAGPAPSSPLTRPSRHLWDEGIHEEENGFWKGMRLSRKLQGTQGKTPLHPLAWRSCQGCAITVSGLTLILFSGGTRIPDHLPGG